jgi:phage shock protein PspC (stress-responsive transcriptional regulator)
VAAAPKQRRGAGRTYVDPDPYHRQAMQLITGSILGLGQSVSSFGTTLALILTFFVVMGGVVNFIVGYIVSQAMVERKQNQERQREYDARHGS